jgi:hypothetical protein
MNSEKKQRKIQGWLEPTVFKKGVIPAPYQVRGKLQPESRVPGENRDPVF